MPLSEKKTGGAVVAATSKLKPGASSEAAAPGGKPVETLQCPRCESMNTKFCYYNNYSVTQPRHFCRQCQRYWTAGGILRNVPVGGGSRKKNRAPYPRMEPYTLGMHHGMHHRIQGSMLAHPASGIMGAFPPAGFHHLVTPDMAAFGGHPHLQHYVPTHAPPDQRNQPNAFYPPGVMYATSQGPSVALQIGSGGTGLTFELNLAAAENNPPPATQSGTQSQANATTLSPSQGGLLSGQFPSVNNVIVPVAGITTGGADHVDARLNPGGSSKTTASPPHGDSTIEEESSTPTNGYSNNGYEEGDAVSSMWHEMHDMDNVLFQ